jgi:hypothetical protein
MSSNNNVENTTTETENKGFVGNLMSSISDRLGSNQTLSEAPVVKERIHESYEHADKTQVEEVHDKTEVRTVVQPVIDEQHKTMDQRRVDEGVEIHEHGQRGLDADAEAQLRARRDEIARQAGTEHTEDHTNISARPDVNVQERTHVVEQVQPVVERDIYIPHKVEHHKKEVEIHHHAPTMGGTRMAPAVTVEEFTRRNGEIDITGSDSTLRRDSDNRNSGVF